MGDYFSSDQRRAGLMCLLVAVGGLGIWLHVESDQMTHASPRGYGSYVFFHTFVTLPTVIAAWWLLSKPPKSND